MNQFLDILSSFLIGGILLLALLILNMNFTSKSHEIKLSEINQSIATEIGKIVEHDFNKIGYGNQVDTSIILISNSSITFKGDLDNNGSIERVRYELISNSNGKFLKRIINNNENNSWIQPVELFNVLGLTSTFDTTSNVNNISSILVNIQFANKEFIEDTLSIGTQWKRRFSPKNIIK